IGVRGNITFDYLNSLGFNKNEIKVLGCPSVYYNGPNYNITSPEINNDSKIALNITPYVNQMTPIVNTISNEFNNYEYFMQDIRDLNLMLYGKEWGPGVQKVRDYYPKILNENKAAFPIDSRSWINNLKNFDYSIGSRLHGTIAALNAGIPGTLIVHDLRTEEIAQYHKMPYVKIEDVYKSIDVKQIAQNSDWDAFNKTSKANYKKLIDFLKENKIEVYSKYPNPTIIEKEKNMKIPPLVRSIYSNNRIDQKSLLSRLQYLEEKNCYTPPFKVVNSTKKRILIEKLKNIIKKI
ncbi:MAG: polysaccharide pyruvyl transferase family protein, partial [Methanobrevibacter sp.]|nr:polysaccharide pyruvyl transferase family protein [Candidatus Methanoflexus mossambicus]